MIKETFKDVLPASEAEAATKAQKEAVKENSTATGSLAFLLLARRCCAKLKR